MADRHQCIRKGDPSLGCGLAAIMTLSNRSIAPLIQNPMADQHQIIRDGNPSLGCRLAAMAGSRKEVYGRESLAYTVPIGCLRHRGAAFFKALRLMSINDSVQPLHRPNKSKPGGRPASVHP